MSLTRSAAAAAVAVALAGFATPAQAQYSESSAWITPFAGAYFGGSFDPASNSYSVNKLDVGTAFTFGARLGYKFNPSIGLVFEYAHADPTLTVKCSSALAEVWCGKEIDLSSNIYEGTFNFYFGSTPQMQGYIAIGGGASSMSATGTDSLGNSVSGSSTQFSTVFGLGGTKMMNEKVGVTLDGRYRWVNVDGADSYYCYYYCYAYDTSWYGSGEITLGLLYKFK
jgi:hypothetical protein